MNNFYKGGRGLAFSQREGGTGSRKEKPPRLSKILINQVEEEGTEGSPNSTRRNRWVFHRFFDVFKARIKYRCSKDVVPFTQRLRKIAEVLLMYRECTVSVRGVYRKGTGDLLRSYWRSTTDPLNACTFGVDQRYSKSRKVVGVEAMKNKSMPFVLALIWFSRRLFSLMALKNKVTLCLTGLLCFMLFNLSDAWAQSAETRTAEGQIETKPLKIGDTIPKELWHLPLQVVNHSEGKDTITLNDFRDKKLIILDFWATWCGSCIRSFPKIDSLNSVFADQLMILPVTLEDPKKVSAWLENQATKFNLPYVFDNAKDWQLIDYFPHRMLPHVVILDANNVRAITAGSELTSTNLQKFLQGDDETFVLKQDSVGFDVSKPFLVTDVDSETNNFQFRSLFIPAMAGVGTEYTVLKDPDRNRVSYKLINLSFKTAWMAVYRDFIKLRRNQFIVPDDCKEILTTPVNYELIVPSDRQHLAAQKIKEDLSLFFGCTADLEVRKVPTLVLGEANERIDKIQEANLVFTKPIKTTAIRDLSAAGLVYAINSIICNDIFAINSLKEPRKLDISTVSGATAFHTLKNLNDWLCTQGLRITIQTNNVDYLTFRKI